MAGTIVSDTTQDGTGNSTSTTTVINGSAKAWGYFTYISSVLTVLASYNVSSITRSATGQYVVTMTNALVDANYATVGSAGAVTASGSTCNMHANTNTAGAFVAPTTTVFNLNFVNETGLALIDPYSCGFAVHR